jgi:hypothetical protein
MERLGKMEEREYTPFIRVLFGLSSPSPVPADLEKYEEVGEIEWVDPTLNDSQKDAIRFALASREIALIHGPPGVSSFYSEYPRRTSTDRHRPAKPTPSSNSSYNSSSATSASSSAAPPTSQSTTSSSASPRTKCP